MLQKKHYLSAWIFRSFSERLKVSLAWYLAIPFHFEEFCCIMWFRISGSCTRISGEHGGGASVFWRCAGWACTCSKVSPVLGGAGSVRARWARNCCRSRRMGSWSISTSVRKPWSWSREGQWHQNALLRGESSVAEAATGSLLLSLMQQERDDKSIIGGSLIGKTTLGNGVCVCSN